MKRLVTLLVTLSVACLLLIPFLAAAQNADRKIEVAAEVDAPVADVWTAWTTCEGIKTFFARDCNIDLRVDGAFAMYMAPSAPEGSRGADNARILAIQPMKMLSFTWDAAPPGNPVRVNRTHVVVRMFPLADNRTRVTITNDGYGEGEDWDKAFAYLGGAWNSVLGGLKKKYEKK